MPYVFVEELGDGMEAADVRTAEEYDTLSAALESANSALEANNAERDELQAKYEEVVSKCDAVSRELDDAKRKFASAFLSSTDRQTTPPEQRDTYKPKTFDSLFG